MAEVKSWDVAVERGLLDLRKNFGAVQAELVSLLGSLPRDAWVAPTVLPGWDVHSIALHLLGGDVGRLASAWEAQPGHPKGELSYLELAESIESSNEAWVTATRLIPPPLVVELLATLLPRVSALFDDTDLWTEGTAVAWTGSGPSPVWLDLAREYTERWVHQAQIREAVAAPPLDQPRWLSPVLDVLMLSMPRAYQAAVAPLGTTVRIEATGAAGGSWSVKRGVDRWHLGLAGKDMASDAALSMPVGLAWRWLTRIAPRESVEAALTTSGTRALWRPALDAVGIMTTRI